MAVTDDIFEDDFDDDNDDEFYDENTCVECRTPLEDEMCTNEDCVMFEEPQ